MCDTPTVFCRQRNGGHNAAVALPASCVFVHSVGEQEEYQRVRLLSNSQNDSIHLLNKTMNQVPAAVLDGDHAKPPRSPISPARSDVSYESVESIEMCMSPSSPTSAIDVRLILMLNDKPRQIIQTQPIRKLHPRSTESSAASFKPIDLDTTEEQQEDDISLSLSVDDSSVETEPEIEPETDSDDEGDLLGLSFITDALCSFGLEEKKE